MFGMPVPTVPAAKHLGKRRRYRGTYGHYPGAWPQIITHKTAARWKKEGRRPKNKIVVSG